jgi:5'-3' exonuclease
MVRKHGDCLRKIKNAPAPDHLFLDANSIIYDCVHRLCKSIKGRPTEADFVGVLMPEVLSAIESYLAVIRPRSLFYIAFDGNPPAAKLYQQRARRHKSALTSKVAALSAPDSVAKWDTTQITPGTDFMVGLMDYLKERLPGKVGDCSVVLDGCGNAGEGEHKIFEHLRSNRERIGSDSEIVIYGLDADLIMLSLNHVHIFPNLNLYRGTPVFMAQIDSDLDPEELYAIDISQLGSAIAQEMGGGRGDRHLFHDYILLCFLLGNDFIPHTPSVCIRTDGLSVILAAYSTCKARDGRFALVRDGEIQWKCMRALFTTLKQDERARIKNEMKARAMAQKRHEGAMAGYEPLRKMDLIPSVERSQEEYVDPSAPGWASRYYDELCDVTADEDTRKMCVRYFEALEWTYAYYSSGCKDWQWSYDYHYAPLFEDMAKYASYFNIEYVPKSLSAPVSTEAQLCIVIPPDARGILPPRLRSIMEEHFSHTSRPPRLKWAFCRYLWEAQVDFVRIDTRRLEYLISGRQNA